MNDDVVLEVKDLRTHFLLKTGVVKAANGVNFKLRRGKVLGIVGESGSGKTVTALSIMGLVPYPGRTVKGEVLYEGRDLLKMDKEELRHLRGNEIAIVFQDAASSLTPIVPIGVQVEEVITSHMDVSKHKAKQLVLQALRDADLSDPEYVVNRYPFELSGGMCQRVMLAMALALNPAVLIADEPTSGLDTTLQAQILARLKRLQQERSTSIIIISHDLGIIAQMADEVIVMYAGSVVEVASTAALFQRPTNPYTWALLQSTPRIDQPDRKLQGLRGNPPELLNLPDQCPFVPRCPKARNECRLNPNPPLHEVGPGHSVACYNEVVYEG